MRYKNIFLVFTSLLVFFSCTENGSKVEHANNDDVYKQNLTDLLSMKSNDNRLPNNIANLDSMKGFRGLKLGVLLRNYHYDDWHVNSSLIKTKYETRRLSKYDFSKSVSIGTENKHYLEHAELIFYQDTLKSIYLHFEPDFYSPQKGGDLLSYFSNAFSQPAITKYKAVCNSYEDEIRRLTTAGCLDPLKEIRKMEGAGIRFKDRDGYPRAWVYVWNTPSIVLEYTLNEEYSSSFKECVNYKTSDFDAIDTIIRKEEEAMNNKYLNQMKVEKKLMDSLNKTTESKIKINEL